MAVNITQQTAVATAALGDQNAGGEQRGWMELNRFHVGKRGQPGLERDGRADTLANHRVGGHTVESPSAPGRDHGGFRHVG